MPTNIQPQDIEKLLNVAGITGFTGQYTPLGGGEGNDTFVLDREPTKLVLRVARHSELNRLANEAQALRLLDLDEVPRLIYFDKEQLVNGREWILEGYLDGTPAEELDTRQFGSLGELLAHVHHIQQGDVLRLDFWQEFLDTKKPFGDENVFLNHPDSTIRELLRRGKNYFQAQRFQAVAPSLIHSDLSYENMLVTDGKISLIDWEYSRFTDPMADFSTMFYEDMEQNKGRWRIHITEQSKAALFAGYTRAGGVLDEQRIKVWQNFDKLGGMVYFYWKLSHSGHAITSEQSALYTEELDKVLESLGQNL